MTDHDESLLSLVYASRAAIPFDHARLVELLAQSRENNARREVTGMLVYSEPDFIQILEGPSDSVRSLLAIIADDGRHTDVRVLLEETIAERRFAAWSMGYEPSDPADAIAAPQGAAATGIGSDDPAVSSRAVDDLGDWFRTRTDTPA
ncbi:MULTISPECIES: BLUF domain-containing protein [unclassified Microbacterium]|uniref:BLUF domain-containing protein n=1 Tax=unclassified Microbacterium TaxID=2609290 RepID=UPI00386A75B5